MTLAAALAKLFQQPVIRSGLFQTAANDSLMEWLDLIYWTLAVALVMGGLAGAVVPILPGLPMVFGGLWLAAWTDGYAHVGAITLSVLGVMLVVGLVMDFIAASIGTKRVGASPQAVSGALIGSIVGLFFGLPGLLIGPFAGAVLGELYAQNSLRQATASGIGAWIGLLLGAITKLVLSLMMIGIFIFDWAIG